jgi:putative ABC transport system permease protein
MAPFLVVRTTEDPAVFVQTVRRSIGTADRGIVVSAVTPLDDLVRDAAAQPQFRTVVLAALAALAIGIAAIGLYGVVAYAVSRRTREIGIRLALGATPREVLTMVLADGAVVAIAGIVAGTVAALAMARLLTGLLYGITPTDPLSFALAGGGLLALTLLASAIPALRAARIDPVGALRHN